EPVIEFAHAFNEVRTYAGTEGGWRFNLIFFDFHYGIDGVHHQADVLAPVFISDFNNDHASTACALNRLATKPRGQVHHRHHGSPQIDNPANEAWHHWHDSDMSEFDDFLDGKNAHGKGFIAQQESQEPSPFQRVSRSLSGAVAPA